jgi:hypothetical protein
MPDAGRGARTEFAAAGVIDPPDQVKLQKTVRRVHSGCDVNPGADHGGTMRLTRTDRDHLRTLAICHYALGGLCFLFGCFPMIHLAIGIAIVTEVIPMQQGAVRRSRRNCSGGSSSGSRRS